MKNHEKNMNEGYTEDEYKRMRKKYMDMIKEDKGDFKPRQDWKD